MTKTTTTRVLGLNHIYIPGLAAGNLGDIGVKSFDPDKLAGNNNNNNNDNNNNNNNNYKTIKITIINLP